MNDYSVVEILGTCLVITRANIGSLLFATWASWAIWEPTHWTIAIDGSASPSSVEQPASAGWGLVVDRVGLLAGVEVECWGEVLTDDRHPRALGADSLSNNSGELGFGRGISLVKR